MKLFCIIFAFYFPFLLFYNLAVMSLHLALNMITGKGFRIGQGGI